MPTEKKARRPLPVSSRQFGWIRTPKWLITEAWADLSRPESTGFGRVGIESLSKVVSKSSEPNGANPECDSTVPACKTRFPAGFDAEESTFVKVQSLMKR